MFSQCLRYVTPVRPPRILPKIPDLIESNNDDFSPSELISVAITDGNNQKNEKSSVLASILPSLSAVRELISYVPTMKNIAMRGHLTGIPYLGDKFDDEDQEIIDSISGETKIPTKFQRSKMTIID